MLAWCLVGSDPPPRVKASQSMDDPPNTTAKKEPTPDLHKDPYPVLSDQDRAIISWPTLQESSSVRGKVPASQDLKQFLHAVKSSAAADATPPSAKATSPADRIGDVTERKSYVGACAAGIPKLAEDYKTDEELTAEYLHFLRSFKCKEEYKSTSDVMVVEDEVEFYISNISSMKERRNFTLEVHFKHMKMHNREWAFSCCNRLEYLKPLFIQATENFLIEQNVSDNEDLIRMRTKLNFIGMPNSIETIDDYIKGKELVKYKRLFAEDADEKNKTDVVILTAVGRMIFLRLLSLLLDLHERNMTLAGGFSLEHIVVIDGVCSILLNPKLATPDDRAKDLRCLEKILTPYYQCKVEEKGSKVMLPLYFKDLQKNLKTADDAMVKEKWFRDYLRFHAAIMPSRGRRNLILGITKVIRKFEQAVAGSSFWTALQHPPPVCLNWRRDAELSKCKIISGVYHHKSESKYEGKQGEEKSVDQSGEQSDYKPNGTALELLIFTREHGDEYVEISDHDEIELYQAHQLCHFLPWLLRRMLSNCNMMKHFGSTWSNYRSSRYDDWDGY